MHEAAKAALSVIICLTLSYCSFLAGPVLMGFFLAKFRVNLFLEYFSFNIIFKEVSWYLQCYHRVAGGGEQPGTTALLQVVTGTKRLI